MPDTTRASADACERATRTSAPGTDQTTANSRNPADILRILGQVTTVAATALACSPAAPPVVGEPKVFSPFDRIVAVSRHWAEDTESNGWDDQGSVQRFRIQERFALTLDAHPSGHHRVTVSRNELLTTPDGRKFRCTAKGKSRVKLSAHWRGETPVLSLVVAPFTLRRTCAPGGFPEPTKEFQPVNLTYQLRGDTLDSIGPPTTRSVLLPLDEPPKD